MKISKGIGVIARLRHLIPFCTLLNIYRSLVQSYISYGLGAWGQAINTHLDKIVILRKAGFASNVFADYKSHSVPLFVNSGILPVQLLYFNRLPPCYVILTIGVLHPVSQIYLLTPNKLTPTPRGRQ